MTARRRPRSTQRHGACQPPACILLPPPFAGIPTRCGLRPPDDCCSCGRQCGRVPTEAVPHLRCSSLGGNGASQEPTRQHQRPNSLPGVGASILCYWAEMVLAPYFARARLRRSGRYVLADDDGYKMRLCCGRCR